jgi:DNA replication protein DnaC
MSAEKVAVMANPEYEQLLENLRRLKLSSLAPVLETHIKRAAKTSMSYQDFLSGLVREALEMQAQRTRERRLVACKFPFIRRLNEFEWDAQPTLNRAEIERLASLRFIDDHDNVAFLGPPGLGKTMLAVGLGVAAVESGYTVRFARLDEWASLAEAAEASSDTTHFLLEWVRPQLVILDEVGHHKLSVAASRAFGRLLTRRWHERSCCSHLKSRLRQLERLLGRRRRRRIRPRSLLALCDGVYPERRELQIEGGEAPAGNR